jgi:ubiquinone/menaquinone biosynthesis C-methylase UbiE
VGAAGVGDACHYYLNLMISKFQDRTYLVSDQYKHAGNLNARIQLHEHFSTNPYGWFRWVFDHFSFPPRAQLLELGCGSGALWSENLARIPCGWQITLSDLSPGMLCSCRQNLSTAPGQFAYITLDAAVLPFKTGTFDAVIANHMLYHLSNLPCAFAQIARVLKPAGILFAATNGEKHLLELDQLIEQHLTSSEKGLLSGKSTRSFTLENGTTQLAPWFNQVRLDYYEDALLVTEADPLLAYIHSMAPRWGIQAGTEDDSTLDEIIMGLIEREGCIRIQKSSGMFICNH